MHTHISFIIYIFGGCYGVGSQVAEEGVGTFECDTPINRENKEIA